MKVDDGDEQVLKCVGFTNETKCSFKEEMVDLGEIPICKREERRVNFVNHHKFNAVFHVSKKLPPYVEVTPTRGKIGPGDNLFLKVNSKNKVIQIKKKKKILRSLLVAEKNKRLILRS